MSFGQKIVLTLGLFLAFWILVGKRLFGTAPKTTPAANPSSKLTAFANQAFGKLSGELVDAVRGFVNVGPSPAYGDDRGSPGDAIAPVPIPDTADTIATAGDVFDNTEAQIDFETVPDPDPIDFASIYG